MAEEEYDLSTQNNTEDTASVIRDIPSLVQKYIFPIDRIRSISSKDPSGRAFESRCHAFYRYIGFPVACEDNSFYSPGHSPPSSAIENPKNTVSFRKTVDDKFYNNTQLKMIISLREFDFKILRTIFARQDLSAALYAFALRYVRPFSGIIDDGHIGEPFFADKQQFEFTDRGGAVQVLADLNPDLVDVIDAARNTINNTTALGKLNTGRHILKPFLVDPELASKVQPPENIICAPFLASVTDTKLNKNVMLQRPVLESIIRLRLENALLDNSYLNEIKNIISGDSNSADTNDMTASEIKFTIAAISEKNELSLESFNKDFESGISTTQLITITDLIKTLKVVVQELHKCFDAIDQAVAFINWLPVPGIEGPEIANGEEQYKFGTNYSEIDKQIIELKAQIFAANSMKTGQATDLGNFAGPFTAFSDNDVEKGNTQLSELENKKTKYFNDAMQSLSNIELISGEVSGLGLIDILSIYIALWSMPESHIVAMLDEDSFNRLKAYNPNLVNFTVQERSNGVSSITITEALAEFEKKLVNILSFVDKEYRRQTINPTDEDGGTLDS